MKIEKGDMIEVVDDSGQLDERYPKIKNGQRFVANGIYVMCCGLEGIDIGMSWAVVPIRVFCPACKALYPTPTIPRYKASRFRKIELDYKVVEVSVTISEQAKELILS